MHAGAGVEQRQEHAPIFLYARIAAAQATGTLELSPDPRESGGVRWEIQFRKGNPELVRTGDPRFGQERFLLSRKLVTEADLAAVRGSGMATIDALVATSRLAPSDAFRHLGGYYRALLARALLSLDVIPAWREGETSGGGMHLGDRWALLMAVGRRLPVPTLERRLGADFTRPILRSGSTLVPLESLGLNAVETRALNLFDGSRSLAELAAAYPEEATAFLAFGGFLAELGLVTFAGRERRDSQFSFDEEVSPDPFGKTLIPLDTTVQEVREARAWLEEMEPADFFHRLGVGRDAPSGKIRAAYLRLAMAYHPDTGGSRGSELRRAREAITALLNEAYETLGDEGRRAAYLEDLRTGAGKKVDVSSILEAERVFHKAVLLVRGRRFEEAVEAIDEALALHGDEAEIWAYRAFASFSAAKDKEAAAASAFADLEKARSLNERCPAIFLFGGRISNVLGDAAKAIRYYERCLELEPGNQDAQRELRLSKSRMTK